MCSIFFSTKKNTDNVEEINRIIKMRGPDSSNFDFRNGTFFIHNLLSITGSATRQPLFDSNDSVGMVFNGEIYNFKRFGDYDNDSKCIIPLYKKYGMQFLMALDGEFAIILADYNKREVLVSTDIFGTKPIFYSNTDGICISTYKHAIEANKFTNVKKMAANTIITFDMDTGVIKNTYRLHDFDLNQHKTSINDWIVAWEQSIKKRAVENMKENTFIGLSSGYDSGAILCELLKQNAKFKAYTMTGCENRQVLEKRWKLLHGNKNAELTKHTITPNESTIARDYLLKNTEDWKYTICTPRSSYNEYHLSLWDDNGSKSLSHLCSMAKADGKKILLSGGGADEIISDYGFGGKSVYKHSCFGGLFPKDLNTIFPWKSFFGSSMQSYIQKEETVGGSYSLEVRYPFLDKKVVQEFLWLTSEYKNSKYKSVIHDYLIQNNFPFAPNEKIGF